MRHVIYGAGGIGGVMGARLHEAGEDVLLIARGAHYEAIRSGGLRLQSAEEDKTLEIECVDHPSKISWVDDDVVYLCMKSQHTLDALNTLSAVASPALPVVSVQNGVANEREALRFFDNIYGICVMCPTNHLEPGIVQAYSYPVTGLFDVGAYPHGVDEVATTISSALARSTYVSEPRPDIMRWKYGKLLMNLGNSVDALCGPAARKTDLFRLVRDEGIAVLSGAGIDYVDQEEDLARRGNHMNLRPIEGQRRGGGSTWQSLERGLDSVETDYMNGEIVHIGRLHGIPAPVNSMLQQKMREAVRGRTPAGSIDPNTLLEEISSSAGRVR